MANFQDFHDCLEQGGVILYPTDTIWGLGCDATNEDACQKIKSIKNRSESQSFIVLVDSERMLERFVPEFHPVCYDLIDHTEEPLTIIYPTSKNLAASVIGKDGSVGIRITKDPFCIKLIQKLKRPIVSTSANISGKPHGKSLSEIDNLIKSKVDCCVDDNHKELNNPPSKIIKINLDGSFKIIRK
ncbi:MAG: L-threonylcarbamoyladenylate synthase [Crocinitomicaceae bacterium]